MTDKYILEGETPVKTDLMTWAKWFEAGCDNRRVASTKRDGIHVSTVFLGLDHQWGEGPPILFETMIFGGPHDEWQDRCSTWDQAIVMHCKACELAGVPYTEANAALATPSEGKP